MSKNFWTTIIFLFIFTGGWIFLSDALVEKDKFVEKVSSHFSILEAHREIFSGPLRSLDESFGNDLDKDEVIKWTNIRRMEYGLPPLSENERLNAVARDKVNDMFHGQYFEHVSPDGKSVGDLASQNNYEYVIIGENLALGNYRTDESLVDAWMNSPGHRANILNDRYSEIGIWVAKGEFQGRTTWLAVQAFGRPLSSCPVIDQALKSRIVANQNDIESLEREADEKRKEIEDERSRRDREEYNRKIDEYNNLVHQINTLVTQTKALVERYNTQVASFNDCIAQ